MVLWSKEALRGKKKRFNHLFHTENTAEEHFSSARYIAGSARETQQAGGRERRRKEKKDGEREIHTKVDGQEVDMEVNKDTSGGDPAG